MSESIVNKKATNPMIIRSAAILGPTMRYNSFLKTIREKSPSLSLKGESTFNYVLQKDLCSFIKQSIEENHCGLYNFSSVGNVSLIELSQMFKSNPKFGNYLYDTPLVDNQETQKICSFAKKTCKQVIEEFVKENE